VDPTYTASTIIASNVMEDLKNDNTNGDAGKARNAAANNANNNNSNGDNVNEDNEEMAENKAEAVIVSQGVPEAKEADTATKYNKEVSFYDNLQTVTRTSQPRIDYQTQQVTDSNTFGSVAEQYRSRHLRGRRRPNQPFYRGRQRPQGQIQRQGPRPQAQGQRQRPQQGQRPNQSRNVTYQSGGNVYQRKGSSMSMNNGNNQSKWVRRN
jgi:hypothetical protein